jgi:hypothetical protein
LAERSCATSLDPIENPLPQPAIRFGKSRLQDGLTVSGSEKRHDCLQYFHAGNDGGRPKDKADATVATPLGFRQPDDGNDLIRIDRLSSTQMRAGCTDIYLSRVQRIGPIKMTTNFLPF